MSKPTISELQKQLTDYKNLFNKQIDEITKLNKELEDTRQGLGVVSLAEHQGILKSLEAERERAKVLQELLEKEKIRKPSRQHNERGAGRKRIEVENKVHELKASGKGATEISVMLHISRSTVNRILNPDLRR